MRENCLCHYCQLELSNEKNFIMYLLRIKHKSVLAFVRKQVLKKSQNVENVKDCSKSYQTGIAWIFK